jgi:hypothetical protein
MLRELYPSAARTISQARGAEDCDVGGTPWHVEVKVGAKPSPLRALRQALRDAEEHDDDRPPLVMCREDRRGWTVTLRWADFARLVSEGQGARAIAVRLARLGNQAAREASTKTDFESMGGAHGTGESAKMGGEMAEKKTGGTP